MRPFLNAIGRHRFDFLSMPGIVSVGFGVKVKNGLNTGVPAIVFGVEKKMPPGAVPSGQMIPESLDSLPTDVVQTGKIRFLGYAPPSYDNGEEQPEFRKKKMRPAQPGVSVGHYRVTAGTLGAVVKGDFPGGVAILSNNHILANGTSGEDGLAFPGDAVLQPGPYDDGRRNDIIARLYAFSPLLPQKEGTRGPVNRIDAALAIPVSPNAVKSTIIELGDVTRTAQAFNRMMVFKSGRSSGVTRGSVISLGNTLQVENDKKKYIFEDQIGMGSMSKSGDSGSLIVNQYGRAVGLLFAGSDEYTYANPIQNVLNYFGVSLYRE
ncbi:MAG: hypothetical protein ACOY46_01155 [Bacillota bacterium]